MNGGFIVQTNGNGANRTGEAINRGLKLRKKRQQIFETDVEARQQLYD